MKGTVYKFRFTILAVLALTLVSIGLILGSGHLTTVQAAGAPAPLSQKPDNSQCLGCHNKPDQVLKFANGDAVSISIDSTNYDHAVHTNLACTVCHTNITGFPHPKNPAGSARDYTLQYKNTCNQCHPDQAKELAGSAHAKLATSGNPNTPICADCHNPHTQNTIKKDANGDLAPAEHATVATTCSKCHSAIVTEYKQSVHGAALFENNNPDVPACDQCHGIHNLKQARTVEFRLNSPQLCATCHTRADIMNKYGISTNVMNTYVADFHGTTVTLFSKERSGADTNKPVCYDCHGVHNIAKVNDPQRGLEIKQNMLAACQRCHPDASQNFPASWMSHYIASPTRFPLVYYVNLFYKFFIPAVLGGMGLFVLSDILHRIGITGRKPKASDASGSITKE
jgi:hypothetical protein